MSREVRISVALTETTLDRATLALRDASAETAVGHVQLYMAQLENWYVLMVTEYSMHFDF